MLCGRRLPLQQTQVAVRLPGVSSADLGDRRVQEEQALETSTIPTESRRSLPGLPPAAGYRARGRPRARRNSRAPTADAMDWIGGAPRDVPITKPRFFSRGSLPAAVIWTDNFNDFHK